MNNKTGLTYYDSALVKADTPNGKDWLVKYLHPPTEKGASYNGYPDKSTVPAIHFEFKLATEGAPFLTNNPNAILLLHTPGLFGSIYRATADSSTGDVDPVYVQFSNNTEITQQSVIADWGRMRNAYLSTTIEYDATGFNNSGIVYGAQFYPSVYVVSVGAFVGRLLKGKQMGTIDKILKLVKNTDPGFHNFVLECQSQFMALRKDEQHKFVPPEPYAFNLSLDNVQIVRLGRNIASAGDIKQLSPKSYQSRSSEGIFVVHQCNQDTNTWQDIRYTSYTNGISSSPSLMYSVYEYYASASNISYLEPFTTSGLVPTFVKDAPWGQWSWAYSYWTNMSPGSAGGSPPQLSINTYQGFEVSPTPGSGYNALTAPAAIYDQEALKNAVVITQSRQDMMMAKYNSGGPLAAIGTSLVGKAIDGIAGAISGGRKKDAEEVKEEVAKAETIKNNEVLAPVGAPVTPQPKPRKTLTFYNRAGPRRSNSKPRAVNAELQREIAQLRAMMSRMCTQPRRNPRSRSRSNNRRSRSRSGNRRSKPQPVRSSTRVIIEPKVKRD